MSDDLVERLREEATADTSTCSFLTEEAANRLEQLESSSEGWKKIADEYFDAICERNTRIEKLEAQLAQSQLKRWAARWEEQADRIEKLETALRLYACESTCPNCYGQVQDTRYCGWTARKTLEGKDD